MLNPAIRELLPLVGENPIVLDYECGCQYVMSNRPSSEGAQRPDNKPIIYKLCEHHTIKYTDQVNYRKDDDFPKIGRQENYEKFEDDE
jgi:hypothetical protein